MTGPSDARLDQLQSALENSLHGRLQLIFVQRSGGGLQSDPVYKRFIERLGRHPEKPQALYWKVGADSLTQPCYPFLSLITQAYQTMPSLPHPEGLYPPLAGMIRTMTQHGKPSRAEAAIPYEGELDFEQNELHRALLAYLDIISAQTPLVIALDDLQQSGDSTLGVLEYLLRRHYSGRLLFLICADRFETPKEAGRAARWNEFCQAVDRASFWVQWPDDAHVCRPAFESEYLSPQNLIERGQLCFLFLAWQEARACFEKALLLLQADSGDQDRGLSDEALNHLADTCVYAGDSDSAILHYQTLISLSQNSGNPAAVYDLHRRMAIAHIRAGKTDSGMKAARQAMKLDWTAGNEERLVKLYPLLIYFQQEEWLAANLDNTLALIPMLRRAGMKNALSVVLTNISFLSSVAGRLGVNEAMGFCRQGISLARRQGNTYRLSVAWHSMGYLYQESQNMKMAMQSYKKCEKLRLELGNRLEIIKISNGLGYFSLQNGLYRKALDYYYQALNYLENEQNYSEICVTLFNTGMVYFITRDYQNALHYFESLISVMNHLQIDSLPFHSRREIYPILGIIQAQLNRTDRAYEWLYKSQNNDHEPGTATRYYRSLLQGLVASYHLRYPEATGHFKDALTQARIQNDQHMICLVLLEWARVCQHQEDKSGMVEHCQQGLAFSQKGIARVYHQLFLTTIDAHHAPRPKRLPFVKFRIEWLLKAARQEELFHQLHRKMDELHFLNQLQIVLARSQARDELAAGVLNLIQVSFPVDSLALLWKTGEEWILHHESYSRSGPGINWQKAAAALGKDQREKLLTDVCSHPAFENFPSEYHSLLSLPLTMDGQTTGIILAAARKEDSLVTQEEFATLSLAGRQISAALEKLSLAEAQNKAMREIEFRNRQIQRELDLSRRVQDTMIASLANLGGHPNLRAGYTHRFLESVGGDLLDIIEIENGCYGLLIADVSGHGVAAAFISAMAKVSFNLRTRPGMLPGDVLKQVNSDLYKLIGDLDHYMAAYFGILNLKTGEFRYANAGHQSAVLTRGGQTEILDAKGLVLGFLEAVEYEDKSITLQPGDRLFLCTDGIQEARGPDGAFFGAERLEGLLNQSADQSPQQFVNALFKTIEEFCSSTPQTDDRAALCLEYLGPA